MINRYIPRIKTATAKNMAQSILSNNAGKKISSTKFKEILKKDKDLKKFAYSGKYSTLDKLKAKKFFKAVIDSAGSHEKLKVNKLAAKKLGLNINREGKASQIGLNKIYQHAVKEEISKTETSTSQQELKKKELRDKAIKQLRNPDRAQERVDEYYKRKNNQTDDNESSDETKSAPARQGGSSGIALTQTDATYKFIQSSDNTSQNKHLTPELPNLLLPPLINLSPTQANIDVITKKIEISVKQKIYNLKIFNVISQTTLNKALMNLGLDKIPIPANKEILKKISLEAGAQLYIYGTVQKKSTILMVNLDIINSETDQKISLASIEQSSLDLFDLEKKINWQIDNALISNKGNLNDSIPSENKAIDLPI